MNCGRAPTGPIRAFLLGAEFASIVLLFQGWINWVMVRLNNAMRKLFVKLYMINSREGIDMHLTY